AADLRTALERSLRALRTDVIDLYYLHDLGPEMYTQAADRYLAELHKARDQGLIRAIGVTERYQSDQAHRMAVQAIAQAEFDVLMVGLNLRSPAAVRSVLPAAGEHNIGIVVMCAVRSVLVNPAAVAEFVRWWEADGLLQPGLVEPEAALEWLIDDDTPSVS